MTSPSRLRPSRFSFFRRSFFYVLPCNVPARVFLVTFMPRMLALAFNTFGGARPGAPPTHHVYKNLPHPLPRPGNFRMEGRVVRSQTTFSQRRVRIFPFNPQSVTEEQFRYFFELVENRQYLTKVRPEISVSPMWQHDVLQCVTPFL
jgi:hypothetical protein